MEDTIIACADLVGRSGATDFELGYLHENATTIADAGWYATAKFRGARLDSGEQQSPMLAAMALAARLLAGAICRCGQSVTLEDDAIGGCRWRLAGQRWEPGCDDPPLKIAGTRGDIGAMQQAMADRIAGRP